MTPEQQKALALARARKRRAEAQPAQASEPSWGDTAVDAAKSLGSGVLRGAAGLVGLPGTLQDLASSGLSWATGMEPTQGSYLSGSAIQGYISGATGGAPEYEPQTTTGKYSGSVGEFIPGAAIGGLNPWNLIRFGVLPGIASEGAGQLTEGTWAEPYARAAAALVAPAIPSLVSRAISPFAGSISPERQRAIQALTAEGVPLTAGQQTGSKSLQFMESELGGGRAASIMDDQARAFTEAATSRAGMQGIASADELAANQARLGQGFTDISARNAARVDQPFVTDFNNVIREYNKVLPTAQKEIVNNLGDDIVQAFKSNNGTLPGDVYQAARSRFSRMAQSARNSDPEYANALRGMRNALDDVMARSIRPEDAAEWARLRREYGNMKVLEKAASANSSALGTITPAQLSTAARTGRQGAYARGTGDFDELARSGNAVMTPLPNSGTAGRVRAQNLGAGILAGGGALTGGPVGFAAGLAAPYVAGRALMSRPVQSYLTNQVAPQMSTIDPRMMTVIQSLIANQGQQ
jgi:hypothetical protein